MKVKCINIYNEHTNQYEASSHWLSIGNEYVVLEMNIGPDSDVKYRLIGDNSNKSPALYNASQFEIVSGEISNRWKISQLKSGALHLSPQSWQKLGFWEDCYDLVPEALDLYKKEAFIMMKKEGALQCK